MVVFFSSFLVWFNGLMRVFCLLLLFCIANIVIDFDFSYKKVKNFIFLLFNIHFYIQFYEFFIKYFCVFIFLYKI